jgi:hypothetical protein
VGIKIIGIAGVAQVGKDTFCTQMIDILNSQGVDAQRVAFADELKKDMDSFLLAKTGVSAYTTVAEEKKSIRPLLVAYGHLMRSLTKGMYWIDKLKEKIEKNTKNDTISIVSDVRYANEAEWINSTRVGITLHLRRNGVHPANDEEKLNDPPTQAACLHSINWETQDSQPSLLTQSLTHINGLNIPGKIIGSPINRGDTGSERKRPVPQGACAKT